MEKTEKDRQVLYIAFSLKWLGFLILLIIAGRTRSQNIQKFEYFFDADPGYHAGIALPVSPPSSHISDFNFNLDISGLSDGFHKLFVRAYNENGVWSLTNNRSFYKNSLTGQLQNLTRVEYFFNTDPGLGNGTEVPFTPDSVITNLSFSIDITGLSSGFHNLFIRTRSIEGKWSLTNQRSFMKVSTGTSLPDVVAAEYFIDTDPGFGQGTGIPVNPGSQNINLDFVVDLTSLQDGFHNLYTRVKDANGRWSLTLQRSFVKQAVSPGALQIVAMEYFFDNDPGFGMGTSIPFAPSNEIIVNNLFIDISSLGEGFHKLCIRARNENDQWSLTNIRNFFKTRVQTTLPEIVEAEYFFNSDPGYGQGIPISLEGKSTAVDIDFILDLTGLNTGFNRLFIRCRDDRDRWGQVTMYTFYRKTFAAEPPDIVYAEYFIDTDPGFGEGNSISIPNPGPHLTDLVFEIDETQLIMGNHMLFVRTRDANGHWSHTLADQFCRSPKPNFATNPTLFGNPTTFTDLSEYTDPNTLYFWDVNGDGVTDYTYNHSFNHTYNAPGTYSARLILVSVEGCSDTIVKPVIVYTCNPPYALQATYIDQTWAVVQWTPGSYETLWDVRYGLQGFDPQSEGTLVTGYTITSFQLSGLASGTSYDFYVRANCSGNEQSSWAGPLSFTTLEGELCINPTDGGMIAESQSVCYGTLPLPFTSLSPASGHTGELQYKWQISPDGLNFQDIPGATAEGYTHPSVITANTWFRRLAKVTCQTSWTGAAESNMIQMKVIPSGLYRSKASGNWNDVSVWEYFDGNQWIDAAEYPGAVSMICPNPLVTIRSSHVVTVNVNITFGNIEVANGGSLVVNDGILLGIPASTSITIYGSLTMYATAVINGGGSFVLSSGAYFYVGSVHGIYISSMLGHIQVSGSRTYANGVNYFYNGLADQVTGDAISQYTPGNITINTTFVVTLSVTISISGNFDIVQGSFNADAYNISLGGNWSNNGVFIPGTSTVYFLSVGNVYVSVSNFYNVVFGGSGTVTANGALTILGSVTINHYFVGGSYTHQVSGNWTNNGTFVNGTSTIYFVGSGNIFITTGNFYNVIFGGTGTISATGPIAFYGNVVINNYFDAGTYVHSVGGDWTNNGTFVPGSSTINYVNTTPVSIGETSFYTIVFSGTAPVTATGSITFEGDVTINTYFDAGSYTHYVYGNWTNNGTFIYGTSTIHFASTVNIYIGTGSFYNIVFAGIANIYASGSLTIYGSVHIVNHFNAGSFTHYIYGNWTNNGVFEHATSTIHFLGSLNISISVTNFYHVIFDGSGTITAVGSLTVYGNLTILHHFNSGSYSHYIYGNWVNIGTFIYGTSTIHFVGNLNITIGASSFYHIVFGGSGTITAVGSLTIYGDLTINHYFNAGSFAHYIYGNWINNGTFIHGTSTIHFVGNLNIVLSVNNFYNVVFAGTGSITATGSLTIYGHITITNHFNAGSFFHYIHGNWINNGTFVPGTSTVVFIGTNVLQTISGSATSTFYILEVNKGLRSRILEVLSPISITATINNWLLITSGTFKLSYASSIYPFMNDDQAVIPVEGGFWNNGGTITGGDFSWYVHGLIRVTLGTINIGTLTGNCLYYYTGSEISIEGGELVVATGLRAFTIDHTVNFYMSGGLIIVANIGNDTEYASFWIPAAGSSFTMSAGTIIIRYTSTYINPVDYHNVAATVNITGGVVQFAEEFIGGTRIYRIGTGSHNIMPGLVLVNAGVSTTVLFNNTVRVYGSVLINEFTALNVNNFHLWVGINWTNYGTFVYGTGTVEFFGSANGNISASDFYHVIFSGSGTKVATGSLTVHGNITISHNFSGETFSHYIYGNWINTGVFVYGTSTIYFVGILNTTLSASDFYHVIFAGSGIRTALGSINVYGNLTIEYQFDAGSYIHYIHGNWINNGIFNYATSTFVFNGTLVQTIGGSAETVFYSLTINNASGVVLNMHVTVNYLLTLTLGLVTTGDHLLTIMPVAGISGGSVTSYINGRLIRGFDAPGHRFFPVGRIGFYRPITYTYVTLTGTSMVEVELIEGMIPGTIPVNITALNRYWMISQTGGSNFTYTVTLDDEELVNYLGHVRILKCDINVTVHTTTTPNYTNVNVFTTISCVGLGIEPCTAPDMPLVTADASICYGDVATLEILSGNLNDALTWVWYADSCGYSPVGTGTSVMVSPEVTTTYYVRGESPCVIPVACVSTTVTVVPLPAIQCPDGICIKADEGAFLLNNALPAGGVYSGVGVVLNQSNQYIFDPQLAGEGSHLLIYTYTHPVSQCVNECSFYITVGLIPYNFEVKNFTAEPGTSCCFNACNTLFVEDVVAESNSSLRFIAGQRILMTPGIHFKAGSIVHAYISRDGLFCLEQNIYPDVPVLTPDLAICEGEVVQLEVLTGNLNSAQTWVWFKNSCDGGIAGYGSTILVMPSETTTYYVRGKGSCLVPGPCSSVTVTVHPVPVVSCTDGFCITADEGPFLLTQGSPLGGVYSGAGVFMNESSQFGFSPALAGEGTHVIKYYFTDVLTGCNDSCAFAITVGHIPYNLHVQDSTINFGNEVCFNACNTITVEDFTANPGSFSRFIAGKRIRYLPGIHFEEGVFMHAFISTNGIFCEEIPLMNSKPYEADSINTLYDIRNALIEEGSVLFRVFPNPTPGVFTLELTHDIKADGLIEIYNAFGKTLLQQRLNGLIRYNFDLTNRPAGMYMIRVRTDDNVHMMKLIKQ